MVWTAPVSPVSGTVITVAWATANVVNPQNWLRLMTGNADPPGSSYVVISSSTTGTAWGKIGADSILDGSITIAKLPFVPVIKSGDSGLGTMQSDGDFRSINVVASQDVIGGRLQASVADGTTVPLVIHNRVMVPNLNAEMVGGQTLSNLDTRFVNAAGDTMTGPLSVTSGDVTTDNRFISTVSSPTPPLLVSSAVECPNLNAHYLQGKVPGALNGNLAVLDSAGAVALAQTSNNAATNSVGAVSIINGAVTLSKMAANSVDASKVVDNSLTHNEIALANQNGGTTTPCMRTLGTGATEAAPGDHVHTGGTAVPSGLIAAVETAAAIPTAWTRYTAADGRLLIGAGTSLGVVWTEATNSGTSWSHDHVTSVVTATSTFTGTGGTTAADATHVQQANAATPNPSMSLGTHQHTFTPAGTVATTLSGNVGDTSWQPAMRGVVWIRKT